jgi:hypothetical protein
MISNLGIANKRKSSKILFFFYIRRFLFFFSLISLSSFFILFSSFYKRNFFQMNKNSLYVFENLRLIDKIKHFLILLIPKDKDSNLLNYALEKIDLNFANVNYYVQDIFLNKFEKFCLFFSGYFFYLILSSNFSNFLFSIDITKRKDFNQNLDEIILINSSFSRKQIFVSKFLTIFFFSFVNQIGVFSLFLKIFGKNLS